MERQRVKGQWISVLSAELSVSWSGVAREGEDASSSHRASGNRVVRALAVQDDGTLDQSMAFT